MLPDSEHRGVRCIQRVGAEQAVVQARPTSGTGFALLRQHRGICSCQRHLRNTRKVTQVLSVTGLLKIRGWLPLKNFADLVLHLLEVLLHVELWGASKLAAESISKKAPVRKTPPEDSAAGTTKNDIKHQTSNVSKAIHSTLANSWIMPSR